MNPSITQYEPYELLSAYDKMQEQRHVEPEKNPNPEEIEDEEKFPFSEEEIRKELLRRMNLTIPEENRQVRAKLKSISHPKGHENREIENLHTAAYQFCHSTPGRDGSTLDFDVILTLDTTEYATHYPNGDPQKVACVSIQLEFGELKTCTVDDAFAKLSEWCQRASIALKLAPAKLKNSIPL